MYADTLDQRYFGSRRGALSIGTIDKAPRFRRKPYLLQVFQEQKTNRLTGVGTGLVRSEPPYGGSPRAALLRGVVAPGAPPQCAEGRCGPALGGAAYQRWTSRNWDWRNAHPCATAQNKTKGSHAVALRCACAS